jgi:hypothetical protein
MTQLWNLTETQRRQLREAQIAAKTARTAALAVPCPDCSVPMIVEDGLWYCADCDAYHGEAS